LPFFILLGKCRKGLRRVSVTPHALCACDHTSTPHCALRERTSLVRAGAGNSNAESAVSRSTHAQSAHRARSVLRCTPDAHFLGTHTRHTPHIKTVFTNMSNSVVATKNATTVTYASRDSTLWSLHTGWGNGRTFESRVAPPPRDDGSRRDCHHSLPRPEQPGLPGDLPHLANGPTGRCGQRPHQRRPATAGGAAR
jgi:hypothetical protein